MVAGCPVTECLECTYPGISFMDCPKWCAWAYEQAAEEGGDDCDD